jgi:3-oxoacyl-[acyl-carrier-protein] synthase II
MFQSIGALDTRSPPISSPFDENRQGFLMGEGAAVFVVKKLHVAIAHGDKILSVIRGIGYASEAYHDTAVHPEGLGGRLAIDMALRKAGLKAQNIDIVSAHATSTPNGDEIEYKTLADYFPDTPVMALKANIGHTMAACSLVELSYLIESMNQNAVGAIPTLNNPIGNDIKLPMQKLIHNFKYGLKNSFGFGGKSASIVMEKYNGHV